MDELDQDGGDAAAQAFEEVRAELTLVRRTVERMDAKLETVSEQPDYSETLGRMTKGLNAALHRIDVLAKAAEDGVAPRYVADRIVAAGGNARDEDRRLLATARQDLDDATRSLRGYVALAREARQQSRWLVGSVIGGAVAGAIIWAAFGGALARATPDSWLWPERMAGRALGGTPWEGALRLAAASEPERWNAMVAGAIIGQANRPALERCQKEAARADEPVRCTIRIEPERER